MVDGRRNGIKKLFANLEKYYDKFPLTLRNNERYFSFLLLCIISSLLFFLSILPSINRCIAGHISGFKWYIIQR